MHRKIAVHLLFSGQGKHKKTALILNKTVFKYKNWLVSFSCLTLLALQA